MANITPLIFGILSLVFAFFAARDYWRAERKLSISARTWLRIALIFGAVALLLVILI